MDARIAAEMALRAAATCRRRARQTHLTWWDRLVLRWAWRSRAASLLLERGAAVELHKLGHALHRRCDAAELPQPEFIDDLTPIRQAPMFLRG